MRDTARETSCLKTGTFCSPCVRAALAALVLAGGLFIALALAAILPEITASWRAALPRPGMNEQEAGTALMKAKNLHEAAVRPQLINAGFVSARDLDDESRWESGASARLTEALWTMRSFPEIHDALFAMLLDTEVPAKQRQERFYSLGSFLARIAGSLERNEPESSMLFSRANPRDSEIREWFRYFNDNPEYSRRPADETTRETHAGKLALAEAVLPVILADVSRDLGARTTLEAKEREEARARGERPVRGASKIWDNMSGDAYRDALGRSISRAVHALWQHRDNASLLPIVREFLKANDAPLIARYDCVPLVAQKPGLPASEYLFWRKYSRDLSRVTSCVGTAPSQYAYIIGCCDTLGDVTRAMMKQRGTMVLDGWHGPGVTLTKTETLQPAGKKGEHLYLLVDMPQALKEAPAYDMSRACPIFAGTLFRYLDNQPQVLPLDPARSGDAALIAWYDEKGWAQGRSLLFSATGSPQDIAQHWGSVHLLWWPDRADKNRGEPKLAYLHPESGHFMLGLLPQLKGKAASRFLGPVTGMWFGRKTVAETGWLDEKYEARPEKGIGQLAAPSLPQRISPLPGWTARLSGGGADSAKTAVPYSDATATVSFGLDITKALDTTFAHNHAVTLANELQKRFPTPEAAPREIFAFTEKNLAQLADWGITRSRYTRSAMLYLWQFRNDSKAVAIMNDTLSKKDTSAHARLEQVRRALGLPEKRGN